MPSGEWRRYLAPAAFLAGVTIAVVLVRAGLHAGSSPTSATTTRVVGTTTQAPATSTSRTTGKRRRYWTVRAGDTFAIIASATGVSVATIRRLNPKVSSTSLFIGEKIRIR